MSSLYQIAVSVALTTALCWYASTQL